MSGSAWVRVGRVGADYKLYDGKEKQDEIPIINE